MPKSIKKTWSVLKAYDPKASANTVILTAEVDPASEAAGDIVRCSGMECPDEVPLLAQHMKHAPDGSPTVLGKVSGFRDSNVMWKGASVPAKLGDIEWADTELSKKYQQLFPKFMKDVSIGAEIIGDPERIKGHGYDYKQTRLFELSIVTFGANPAAESVKAIKAALGDAISEDPSGEPTADDLIAKIDNIGGVLVELLVKTSDIHSQFVSKENWNLNRFEKLEATLTQINKRLDDFECYLVSKSDESEQTADSQAPQAQEIDLSAVLALLSKAAKK